MNLVGNAIKFTDQGFIKLGVKAGADVKGVGADNKKTPGLDLVFTVEDSGVGISSHQQQEIFEAFHQQQGHHTETYGGVGLGLAICNSLVEMMGGEITLQSQVGKGSTFTVILKNIEITPPEEKEIKQFKIDVTDIRFKKASILVVDDKEMNRELIMDYLQKSDIDFIEARNGIEAVKIAKDHLPDIILMDKKMPEMDGVAACKLIKESPLTQDIPIIMITASVVNQQLGQVKDFGSDGFLGKPVNKNDLVIELTYHLPYFSVSAPAEPGSNPAKNPDRADTILSLHSMEMLPELVNLLQSEELSVRLESLKKKQILDEIEDFSMEMKALAKKYHVWILSNWVDQLSHYLQTYKLDKMNQALMDFPQVAKEIAALNAPERTPANKEGEKQ